MSKIDSQTHRDVVALIGVEMRNCKRTRDYTGAPERLASAIEGRLGYETPQKSVISNLPQLPWRRGHTGRQVTLSDADGNTIVIYEGAEEGMDAFLKLCIAAPDLLEYVSDLVPLLEDITPDDRIDYAIKGVELLKKAGVAL